MTAARLARFELRRLARRNALHATRSGLLTAAVGLVALWMFILWLDETEVRTPPEIGALFAATAFLLQIWIGFAIGFVAAATELAREKSERTLELVLMAERTGWDIVLARFAAAYARVCLLIPATAPLLALAALMAPITVRSLAIATGVCMLAAAWTTALGLACGARFQQFNASAITGTVAILGVLALTGLLDWFVFFGIRSNPIWAVWDLLRWDGPTPWLCIAWLAVFTFVHLGQAAYWLPRWVYGVPARTPEAQGRARTQQLRETAIIGAVVQHARGGSGRRYRVLRALVLAGSGAIMLLPLFGWWFVLVLLFREIMLAMEGLRKSGVIDEVRLTPLDATTLGRAFYWGFLGAASGYFLVFGIVVGIYIWMDEAPLQLILVAAGIVYVSFCSLIATAVFAATFHPQVGALFAYVFSGIYLFTWTLPLLYVLVFLPPAIADNWGMFVNAIFDTVAMKAQSPLHVAAYILAVLALHAAVVDAAVWAAGRRLRQEPLFRERRPRASPDAGTTA